MCSLLVSDKSTATVDWSPKGWKVALTDAVSFMTILSISQMWDFIYLIHCIAIAPFLWKLKIVIYDSLSVKSDYCAFLLLYHHAWLVAYNYFAYTKKKILDIDENFF